VFEDGNLGIAHPVERSALAVLAVRKLVLTAFRCYAGCRLEPDGRPVVLTGPNGAGKTNLLEAISFLAPGRGLRRARIADPDRHGQSESWAVAAELETACGPVQIGTGREAGTERRAVRINGAPVKNQAMLAEYVSVVWMTPQLDCLFLDGAGVRRRFLDRLVYGFDPAHAGRVAGYEQALRERARLLKGGNRDDAWVSALERQMAERGVAIAAARREMAARLDAACKAATGPFPGASVGIVGDVEAWLDQVPALTVEERLRSALAEGRGGDAETGGASVGPHRSDLAVRHVEKDMPAALCSTGEQKALLIAIVLADLRLQAAERGTVPLLLLDEVAAHLDEEIRAALFETILELGAQAWMTGADARLFAPLGDRVQRYAVENAALART